MENLLNGIGRRAFAAIMDRIRFNQYTLDSIPRFYSWNRETLYDAYHNTHVIDLRRVMMLTAEGGCPTQKQIAKLHAAKR